MVRESKVTRVLARKDDGTQRIKKFKVQIWDGEEWLDKGKPAEYLAKLVGKGAIALSADMFVNKSGEQRIQALLTAIGVDTSELDESISRLKSERTALKTNMDFINKELKLDPIDEKMEPKPYKLENLKAEKQTIDDNIQAKSAANDLVVKYQSDNTTQDVVIANCDREIERLQVAISAEREKRRTAVATKAQNNNKISTQKNKITQLESKINMVKHAELSTNIDNLVNNNVKIEANNKKKERQAQKVDMLVQYNSKMDLIKDLKSRKAQLIADKVPIPDLEIGDDDILYKGNKGSTLSTGEALIVGCAIRMTQESNVDFLFVDNATNLGKTGLDIIHSMCLDDPKKPLRIFECHNFNVDTPGVTLEIEDGTYDG